MPPLDWNTLAVIMGPVVAVVTAVGAILDHRRMNRRRDKIAEADRVRNDKVAQDQADREESVSRRENEKLISDTKRADEDAAVDRLCKALEQMHSYVESLSNQNVSQQKQLDAQFNAMMSLRQRVAESDDKHAACEKQRQIDQEAATAIHDELRGKIDALSGKVSEIQTNGASS